MVQAWYLYSALEVTNLLIFGNKLIVFASIFKCKHSVAWRPVSMHGSSPVTEQDIIDGMAMGVRFKNL